MTSLHAGSFELGIPRDWVRIALLAGDRSERIAEAVAAGMGSEPTTATLRRSAEALLRTAASAAAQAGGVLFACYAQLTTEEPRLLLANLTVSLHGLTDTPTAELLAALLAGADDANASELATVDLADGSAARAESLIDLQPDSWPAPLGFRRVQYLLPLDGAGVIALTFTTPESRWAKRFVVLFDRIATTLVIHREEPVRL